MVDTVTMTHTHPTQAASLTQRQAAQPDVNIWVSASAGSGKTKVLTDRVLTILLQGVAPRRILCLTYTRAAAAEMTMRLLQRLSHWASLNQQDLRQELYVLLGQEATAIIQRRAQRLFIDVLNVPGGLNIQTIHSFCQSILKKFPLEAALSPHFEVIDSATHRQFINDSIQAFFSLAERDDDLRTQIHRMTSMMSIHGITERLQNLLAKPLALRGLKEQGLDTITTKLYDDLGIDPAIDAHTLLHNYFNDIPLTTLTPCLHALHQGSPTDQQRAQLLTQCWQSWDHFQAHFKAYQDVFLTQDHTIRARLATKSAQACNADILPLLEAEALRVQTLVMQQKAYSLADQAAFWMRIGLWIFDDYAQKKQQQALVDYDDLLIKAYELLHTPSLAPFILYKLDGGIHHILVDEAQDTSPLQWALIAAVVEEFFSGQGSLTALPTLFVVGDFKQSIYSFQGAEPQLFHQMRDHFADKIQQAQQRWQTLTMDVSFRSTPPVLAFVDHVFSQSTVSAGVMDPGTPRIQHFSYLPQGPGCVELWPLVPTVESSADTDESNERQGEERMAEVIACQIRSWLDRHDYLETLGRSIQPGDILILVQRRHHFLYALLRALKRHRIPTTGLDRLDLMDHMAVKDLLTMGRFLLLPEDSMSLAILLKSPLYGWDDEMLLQLSQTRGDNESLWSCLKRCYDDDNTFSKTAKSLRNLLKRVDYISPFHLFSDVLYVNAGLKKFLSRMGLSVQEVLEEFLSLVHRYEANHESSLQKFIHWCEHSVSDIKRDLASPEMNEVRILTVHGAKGLQAPIVILPDTIRIPDNQDYFLTSDSGYLVPHLDRTAEPPLLTALKAKERQKIMEEYYRLLYVALTRAQERLYVCGWQPRHEVPELCWYALCQQGLAAMTIKTQFDFTALTSQGWQGEGYRFHQSYSTSKAKPSLQNKLEVAVETKIPGFLTQPAPQEEAIARAKIASRKDPDSAPITTTPAMQRGLYIHKLLEMLPSMPENQWQIYAERIAREYTFLESTQDIIDTASTLLHHPELRPLFMEQSYAEVPIAGMIDNKPYSIKIDRLVIRNDRIVIIDYKSNSYTPTSRRIPIAYRHQLDIYRRLVQDMYSEKNVETYILWTQTATLMKVD